MTIPTPAWLTAKPPLPLYRLLAAARALRVVRATLARKPSPGAVDSVLFPLLDYRCYRTLGYTGRRKSALTQSAMGASSGRTILEPAQKHPDPGGIETRGE
jgi:hypothetical protein